MNALGYEPIANDAASFAANAESEIFGKMKTIIDSSTCIIDEIDPMIPNFPDCKDIGNPLAHINQAAAITSSKIAEDMDGCMPMLGQSSPLKSLLGPQSVEIGAGIRKIIFLNIYKQLRIEYYKGFTHYGSDILNQGEILICFCNPDWQLNICTRDLQVKAHKNSGYYLKKALCNWDTSVLYICVVTMNEQWNNAYDKLIAKPDLGQLAFYNMKTYFIDDVDEYFACASVNTY